jgi:flagellar hook-associated protein 3 FlgL
VSTFRVTQRTIVDRSLGGIQMGLSRLSEVQEQLSTGRRINRASDSPTDAASAMRLRSQLSAVEQFSRNAQDGMGRLKVVDDMMTDVTETVISARGLAVQGANSGSMSPASREALAVEVDQLREAMLDQANATYLSRPVFGGTVSGDKAYDTTGAFVGDGGAMNRRIADGTRVRVDVDGRTVFGDGATSVFAELSALSTALRAGDQAGVQTSLTALDLRQKTVSDAHAKVGATYKRIEQAQTNLVDAELNLKSELAEVENIDLPKTTMDLNMAEFGYKTALAASARVMQPSLMEFLR